MKVLWAVMPELESDCILLSISASIEAVCRKTLQVGKANRSSEPISHHGSFLSPYPNHRSARMRDDRFAVRARELSEINERVALGDDFIRFFCSFRERKTSVEAARCRLLRLGKPPYVVRPTDRVRKPCPNCPAGQFGRLFSGHSQNGELSDDRYNQPDLWYWSDRCQVSLVGVFSLCLHEYPKWKSQLLSALVSTWTSSHPYFARYSPADPPPSSAYCRRNSSSLNCVDA